MPVDPQDAYSHILLNDMAFLNKHFHKYHVLRKHPVKWYHPVYGKYLLKNIYFTPGRLFSGLRNLHIPTSMRKSTYQKLWSLEHELLHQTCKHRFRSEKDVNQNIMSFYDICSGNFSPRSAEFGKCYSIGIDTDSLLSDLRGSHHKLIFINDHPYIQEPDAEEEVLLHEFNEKFPNKSSFEQ